ncbi:unnamed protein product [Darwinula stevensoni]|uniref:Neurotransmitter-gated ion-channel ligand-binding domain-containing protein n=1 Tax=Darwinula stevensoni TaxID=69355 RepID=A0A7R9A3J4_9CRUS|nr:unnamed protein product [Darwinula stevensoni]CAG0891753.1 unnamed protein product [Darwinula stevensoni]
MHRDLEGGFAFLAYLPEKKPSLLFQVAGNSTMTFSVRNEDGVDGRPARLDRESFSSSSYPIRTQEARETRSSSAAPAGNPRRPPLDPRDLQPQSSAWIPTMNGFVPLLLFLAPLFSLSAAQVAPKGDFARLRRDLLVGYDEKTKSGSADSPPVVVRTGFTFVHIDFDDVKGELLANFWMKMVSLGREREMHAYRVGQNSPDTGRKGMWEDDRLTWKPDEYGGIGMINLPPQDVWRPDVTLYNDDMHFQLEEQFGTKLTIAFPNGTLLWVPSGRISSHCVMDFAHWPMDTQTCQLKFGSWTYSAKVVDLRIDSAEVDLKYLEKNSWTVVETSVKRNEVIYECCPEPYVDVTVVITARRESPTDRIIVYLQAIGTFLLVCLLLSTISCIWYGVLGWLESPARKPLPPSLNALVTTCLAPALCLRDSAQQVTDEESEVESEKLKGEGGESAKKARKDQSWNLFTACLHRLLFLLVLVIMVINFAIYFPRP